jgi:Protein of unknown function (DUF2721)
MLGLGRSGWKVDKKQNCSKAKPSATWVRGRDRPSHPIIMPGIIASVSPLDTVAHIIQLALTPVFLLSGIGALLNVFATRLARVADRVDQITKEMEGAEPEQVAILALQMGRLRRRSLALDVAVVLAAFGAAATCASVLTLLVGALRDATVASILFATFGFAVVCTIGAILAYTAEMLMTGSGVRAEVAAQKRSSNQN